MHSSPRKPSQTSFNLYVLLMEKWIAIHISRLGTCHVIGFFFFFVKFKHSKLIGGVKRF